MLSHALTISYDFAPLFQFRLVATVAEMYPLKFDEMDSDSEPLAENPVSVEDLSDDCDTARQNRDNRHNDEDHVAENLRLESGSPCITSAAKPMSRDIATHSSITSDFPTRLTVNMMYCDLESECDRGADRIRTWWDQQRALSDITPINVVCCPVAVNNEQADLPAVLNAIYAQIMPPPGGGPPPLLAAIHAQICAAAWWWSAATTTAIHEQIMPPTGGGPPPLLAGFAQLNDLQMQMADLRAISYRTEAKL